MLLYLFKATLITSLAGTVLTVILALFKPLTRKHFSTNWHYYIWLVVLFSMLLPFRFTTTVNTPDSNKITSPHIYLQESTDSVYYDSLTVENTTAEADAHPSGNQSRLDSIMHFAESKASILAKVWLFGMVLSFLATYISYIVFLAKLRKETKAVECPQLRQFTDRKISTKTSDNITSPFMVGIFKPTLILPGVNLNDSQLNCILAHEITHYKRKDILYKWFLSIVKCIHWFNPIVFYISRQINNECEVSCDLAVVNKMNKEQKIEYMNTILSLITAKRQITTMAAKIVSNKNNLKRRFTMINSKFIISKKAMLISVAVAIALLGGTIFASGIINATVLDKPEASVSQTAAITTKPQSATNADTTTAYNTGIEEVVQAVNEVIANSSKPITTVPDKWDTPSAPEATDTAPTVAQEETPEFTTVKTSAGNDEFVFPCDGQITRGFGKRENPETKDVIVHNGIDIMAPEGATVVASISGTVKDTGFNNKDGNYIIIENNGTEAFYSHLADINVTKGDNVKASEAIGTVGTTGNSTGPHLHFEVTVNSQYVNPENFF